MFPFSDEDLFPAVSTILEKKIAPILAQDGGAIQLINVKNSIIFVQLQGACVGCSASGTTLKYTVEKALKELIHPELRVVNVPSGMENKLEELV